MDKVSGKVVEVITRKPGFPAGHGHARTRRAGCSDVARFWRICRPGRGQNATATALTECCCRRRAVQCQILLPVIFRAVGSTYCTINAVEPRSSDICNHPWLRLVSWPSSPRDRWMRVWRRLWRKPGINPTAWGQSSCRRRSASRCVEPIRERDEAKLPRALQVVLVRERPWWFQLQPTEGLPKLRSTRTS